MNIIRLGLMLLLPFVCRYVDASSFLDEYQKKEEGKNIKFMSYHNFRMIVVSLSMTSTVRSISIRAY